MGRKRIPDSFCVMKDSETGQFIVVEPTSQPSYFVGKRYVALGYLNTKEDAEQFIQFKKLGASCDELAYLQKENEIRKKKSALPEVDISYLENMCEKLRESSGRTCFGCCRSLEGQTACKICYENIPRIWGMCATIQGIKSVLRELEPSSPYD